MAGFDYALQLLAGGNRVAREGWNGKGMWVCQGRGSVQTADKFWNEHTREFAENNGGQAEVLPYLILKTADDKILMGWTPNSIDVLAQDWDVVI